MFTYDAADGGFRSPDGRIKICITSRQLLTGTADYTDRVRSQILQRLSLIGDLHLADAVILREKDLSVKQYRELALAASDLCRQKHLPLILHGFSEVAAAFSPAVPLHLSMPDFLKLKRKEKEGLCSPAAFAFLGVSTHTLEEAVLAQRLGASYITASHIFPTACKQGLPPRGPAYLREVCTAVSIPVFALGGIHPENMDACFAAGAAGVCMMSEYFSSREPGQKILLQEEYAGKEP